jgi:Flp pilus assembly protein TadG
MTGRRTREDRGQALVEFSLAILVFLALVMGIIDFGRGIYTYNGVSQAAREIARATSVQPPSGTLGGSTHTQGVVNTQKALIPGLGNPVFTCIDATTMASKGAATCIPGDLVEVRISAPFSLLTPVLGQLGPFVMQASSTIEMQ